MRVASPRTVLFVAFDDVGLMDLCGPLTVFRRASRFLSLAHKIGYDGRVVSIDGGPVSTWDGVTVMSAPVKGVRGAIDTIVVPGGTMEATLADQRLVAWVARHGPAARRVCSVCSGAYLLAEAGLLDGRRAVTHWMECETLKRRYPAVTVEPNAIFVRDDPIWSSAGVTAGIDLALALVQDDHNRELAMRIARELVVFFKRPGGQSQFSALLEAQTAESEVFANLHQWLMQHLAEPSLSVETLAQHACMSLRNFARAYKAKTGRTPAKAIELFRLEAARRLLEDTDERIEAIVRRTGFGTEERMRITFQRHLNVNPRQYRERFGRREATATARESRRRERLGAEFRLARQ
jgi:transcriptional regulator GlxA family with amidase domain